MLQGIYNIRVDVAYNDYNKTCLIRHAWRKKLLCWIETVNRIKQWKTQKKI